MSAQHTPGPWVVDDRPLYGEGAGIGATPLKKGACVADVSTGFSTHSIHAPSTIGRQCPSVAEMDAQGLANAHLIAAAPDMLEALKYARRFVCEDDVDVAFIDASIAKAEGR